MSRVRVLAFVVVVIVVVALVVVALLGGGVDADAVKPLAQSATIQEMASKLAAVRRPRLGAVAQQSVE